MAKYEPMTPTQANLFRTLLSGGDEWEIHSFKITDEGDLAYGGSTITSYDDGSYLGYREHHTNCGDSHFDCHREELETMDAHEVLEWASKSWY